MTAHRIGRPPGGEVVVDDLRQALRLGARARAGGVQPWRAGGGP